MDTEKEIPTIIHQESEIFDGNQLSPQFAVALKNFFYQQIGVNSSITGRAHLASGQSVGSGSDVLIALDTASFPAAGITWTNGSHPNAFIALAAGKYQVSGSVNYSSPTGGRIYQANIFVNGARVSTAADEPGGISSITVNVSDVLNLAVGDYVELYAFHNSAGAVTAAAGSDLTRLSIAKV